MTGTGPVAAADRSVVDLPMAAEVASGKEMVMYWPTILLVGRQCRQSAEPVIDAHQARAATLGGLSRVDEYPLDTYGDTRCPRLGDRTLKR